MYYATEARWLADANHEIRTAQRQLSEIDVNDPNEYEIGADIAQYISPFYKSRRRHMSFLMHGRYPR